LLELLDEKKLRETHKVLEDEFNSLSSNMASARESVKKINEEVDNVVLTKLDDSNVVQMKTSKDTISGNLNRAKILVSSYRERISQASHQVLDIRSSPLRTDFEIDVVLKSSFYMELPSLIASIKTEDENSVKSLSICEDAKRKATQAMVGIFYSIGRVLLDIEHTQKNDKIFTRWIAKISSTFNGA